MTIPTFTLKGNIYDLLDTNNDGSVDTVALTSATVTFTPNTKGQFLAIGDNLYRPEAVTVTVDGTGRINGASGVVLLANDDSLNLVIPLQWNVSLTMVSDFPRRPRPFWFEAPTAGSSVTLGSVAAIPATTATGFSRGPAGPTGATGPAGPTLWSALTGIPTELLTGANVANGYAKLDSGGLVPAALLPSYVDDVLEYTNLAGFPAAGETGKIYVDKATQKIYRWSGSTYIEISPSPGSTDSVTEGATNLYFTTARASAASAVQSVAGRTGVVTLTSTDVNLGNVSNVASTAAATASTVVQRDSNANIAADNFISTVASTVTAAGTTTLAIDSAQVQVFTGTTTHTVLLPTTGVTAGQTYTIINNSTGAVAVQSSTGATVVNMTGGGQHGVFYALVSTPTTSAHWRALLYPSGGLMVSTAAAQTLTNKTLTSPAITSPTGITKSDVGLSNVTNVEQEAAANKNVANGYAGLDASALIPQSLLPSDVTTTSVVSVTGTTTLGGSANRVYVVLLGSGAVPTLPTAVGNTSIYHLKNVHSAPISVALTSSQTIDGGAGSLTILPKQSFSLVSDNANWWII